MLPLRWFDNRATGDLMTRILEDVNSVERTLIDGIEQGVVAVRQMVIVLRHDVLFQHFFDAGWARTNAVSGRRRALGTRCRRTGGIACSTGSRR